LLDPKAAQTGPIPLAPGGPRLARIGGRVNRNPKGHFLVLAGGRFVAPEMVGIWLQVIDNPLRAEPRSTDFGPRILRDQAVSVTKRC
jgi:hypothetical protein